MSDQSYPDNKNPALIDLEDKYEMVDYLMGGTAAMREAGTKYLPREPGEETQNYHRRLNSSVLFPAYANAITASTGKLFANPLEISMISPSLNPLLDTIDEDNNSINVFAEMATTSAINYGCSYILIDYPVMNENATLADEKAAGAQPYWVLLEAPQILEASPIKQGGKRQLGFFRFKEREAYRTSDFSVSYRERVKDFRLIDGKVVYRVFIKQENKWVLSDEGLLLGLTEIPVVPVYSNKVGFFLGSPLFEDLAEENILNWKMRSDYNNVVHMVTIPMLSISGASHNYDDSGLKQEIVISPNTVLEFTNPDTKAEWIEVSGSASGVGREAVQDSYTLMSTLSLESLNDGLENQTATAAKLNAEESNSIIRVLKHNIENSLNNAIDFTYQYLNTPNPGTKVALTTNEDKLDDDPVSQEETSEDPVIDNNDE